MKEAKTATTLAKSILVAENSLLTPLSSFQVLTVSMTLSATQLDLIEELKLRRWARENYVPQTQRNGTWHPVVHDEMTRKDSESPATSLAS